MFFILIRKDAASLESWPQYFMLHNKNFSIPNQFVSSSVTADLSFAPLLFHQKFLRCDMFIFAICF